MSHRERIIIRLGDGSACYPENKYVIERIIYNKILEHVPNRPILAVIQEREDGLLVVRDDIFRRVTWEQFNAMVDFCEFGDFRPLQQDSTDSDGLEILRWTTRVYRTAQTFHLRELELIAVRRVFAMTEALDKHVIYLVDTFWQTPLQAQPAPPPIWGLFQKRLLDRLIDNYDKLMVLQRNRNKMINLCNKHHSVAQHVFTALSRRPGKPRPREAELERDTDEFSDMEEED